MSGTGERIQAKGDELRGSANAKGEEMKGQASSAMHQAKGKARRLVAATPSLPARPPLPSLALLPCCCLGGAPARLRRPDQYSWASERRRRGRRGLRRSHRAFVSLPAGPFLALPAALLAIDQR